jgi:hypothetical protein
MWDLARWRLNVRVGAAVITAAFLLLPIHAPAATVHKTDDSVVTGDMLSIADGKLTLSAQPKPVVIPLDDILQIVMKDAPAAPVARPAPPPEPVNDAKDDPAKDTVLGSLFGSSHPSAAKKEHPVPPPAPGAHAAATTQPAGGTATKPTTQIASAPLVTMNLTDGDVLHAKLLSWADQKLSARLTAGPSLELPSTAVTEIWFGALDTQAKAKALTVEPGPEDVAFVSKESDVVAVRGLAIGISNEALRFNYDGEDRKIGLKKLVGVLLRSNSPAPIAGFHQLVHIDTGEKFSGTLAGIDHGVLLLSTPAATMRIQISSIASIDFVNGKVSSLCDLKPSKVEETGYFGRVMPFQVDKSLTGGPLLLSDGPCARGIAVHSRCALEYDVSSGFDHLKTRLGFQQPEGQQGRVLARVLGDGKVLYENPDARGDQPPIDIDVPLKGVKTLTLLVDFGKDQDVGDRVVWANPRLVRGK